MKANEKICPRCAEVVKLEALACKHCGHEFSPQEIEDALVAANKKKKLRTIDNALAKYAGMDGPSYLELSTLYVADAETLAKRLRLTVEDVLERARHWKMDIDEREPEPSDSYDPANWSPEKKDAVDTAIRDRSVRKRLGLSEQGEIADQHRVYLQGVGARAQQIGYKLEGIAPISRDRLSAPPIAKRTSDMQYGALQGVANVAGGCATMWGVVLLLFCIVLIFVAVAQIFS